jgi:hexosaminidase
LNQVFVVPEPKTLRFTGKWFRFDGFENFPDFHTRQFNLPKGSWRITEAGKDGTGLEIKDGEVIFWGDESVEYATILQLVQQGREQLPEVTIQESLKFKFRGYHLDIARGGVPKVDTFKKLLKWLFLLKYNHLAIYFEDLFPWRSHPQIGERRGRMTEAELNEIVDYGKSLGLTVFPSLELSGHMEQILSLPDFQDFSEWGDPREGCLDLSNEKAREFAYQLLEEVVKFFPSKFVHIGGDETYALGRGKSLSKTWRFEGPTLYESHHRRIIEIIQENRKQPMLNGDMIAGMYLGEQGAKWAELIKSDIWKKALVVNWDYSASPKEHFKQKIRLFKDNGIDQLACPGFSNWNTYYPNFQTAMENLKNFLTAAKEEELPGFLVTAWGDNGEECLLSFLDPLLLAAIEIAEGNERWQEKWMAIRREDESIVIARILFGNPGISEMIKHVIFKDSWFQRSSPQAKEDTRSLWERTLKEIGDRRLPEDLDFFRKLLRVGLKVLNDDVKVSDYLMLSNLYSKLWLAERKPEGLDVIVGRFWAAAAMENLGLGTQ